MSAEQQIHSASPKHLRDFGISWTTAAFGRVHISKVRLQSGGKVGAVDSLLVHTHLHRAAMMVHADVAGLSVESEASNDIACSRSGATPLRVAA